MKIFETAEWKKYEVELTALYSALDRFYHNLTHVQDCLEQLNAANAEDRESIALALWFHDAIYDPKRSDNESASAALATEWLIKLELAPEQIERVNQLIQITNHNSIPETADEKLIVDIDLSILGREADIYERYAKAIRQEYAHVPETAYRSGRLEVLRRFLKRDHIFNTDIYRAKYGTQARKNLESEISWLSEQPPERQVSAIN